MLEVWSLQMATLIHREHVTCILFFSQNLTDSVRHYPALWVVVSAARSEFWVTIELSWRMQQMTLVICCNCAEGPALLHAVHANLLAQLAVQPHILFMHPSFHTRVQLKQFIRLLIKSWKVDQLPVQLHERMPGSHNQDGYILSHARGKPCAYYTWGHHSYHTDSIIRAATTVTVVKPFQKSQHPPQATAGGSTNSSLPLNTPHSNAHWTMQRRIPALQDHGRNAAHLYGGVDSVVQVVDDPHARVACSSKHVLQSLRILDVEVWVELTEVHHC